MSQSIEVTISIPEDVLEAVEREREAESESRSEFFRCAAESLIRFRRQREAENRYIAGYQQHPESVEEVAANWTIAQATFAGDPWE